MTKPDTVLDDMRLARERIEALAKDVRSITMHPDDMAALHRSMPAPLGWWPVAAFSDASVAAPGKMVVRWSDGSVTVESIRKDHTP